MTPAALTAPDTTDQIIDHTLRQIEAAWVTEEFDAIIAANWPTEPPEPPPAAGPTHPEPPRPTVSGSAPAAGPAHRSAGPSQGARPATCATPGRAEQIATPSSHPRPDLDGRAGAAKLVRPDGRRPTTAQPGTAELPARSSPPNPRRDDDRAKPPSPT